MDSFKLNKDYSVPLQRLSNGMLLEPLKTPLQRYKNQHLEPGTYEKRILDCKKNLHHLKNLKKIWGEKESAQLREIYTQQLAYFQEKLDTAHDYLIEVSTPNTL